MFRAGFAPAATQSTKYLISSNQPSVDRDLDLLGGLVAVEHHRLRPLDVEVERAPLKNGRVAHVKRPGLVLVPGADRRHRLDPIVRIVVVRDHVVDAPVGGAADGPHGTHRNWLAEKEVDVVRVVDVEIVERTAGDRRIEVPRAPQPFRALPAQIRLLHFPSVLAVTYSFRST